MQGQDQRERGEDAHRVPIGERERQAIVGDRARGREGAGQQPCRHGDHADRAQGAGDPAQ